MITKFNDWYDSIKEPWRMLFMLVIISPVILILSRADVILLSTTLTVISTIYFILFLLVIVDRVKRADH